MPWSELAKQIRKATRQGDTERVKKLLEEAGYPVQGDFTRPTTDGLLAKTWHRRAQIDRREAGEWERYSYKSPGAGAAFGLPYAKNLREEASIAEGNADFFA